MSKITLNLPTVLHDALKKWKKTSNVSVNDYCYQAIARKAVVDGIIELNGEKKK